MVKPTLESYDEIQHAYDHFNETLFGGQLPSCMITFQRQKRIMGYVSFRRWVNAKSEYVDELAINPEYFASYPTIEICQTLCHEMVHIWQAHYGIPSRRGYHNAQWARKMKAIGLISSTTGKPGGEPVGEKVSDYILHDGPFFKACHALFSKGFELKWVDTFPVYRNNAPVKAYDSHGLPIQINASVTAMAPAVASKSSLPEWEPDEKDEDELYNAALLKGALTPSGAAEPYSQPISPAVTVISTQPLNKSNRHKYVCKVCAMQLWGKPDLHVICGTCHVSLTEYS